MDESPAISIRSEPRPWLAVFGVVVEFVAFGMTLPTLDVWDTAPPIGFLVAHSVASLLSGLAFPGWRRSDEPDERHRLGPVAFLFSFCFPLIGSVSCICMALIRSLGKDFGQEIVNEHRALIDGLRPKGSFASKEMDEMESRSSSLDLQPFLQLLGSPDSKDLAASAIESVQMLERPVANRLLRHALSSDVVEARYYASKALARMEDRLDQELEKARQSLAKDPLDPERLLRMADTRLQYGDLGEPGDPVNRLHLLEAVKIYEQILGRLDGEKARVCRAKLADTLLALGRAKDAVPHYCEVVRQGTRSASILKRCLEACYLARDFQNLDRHIEVALERRPDSGSLRQLARNLGRLDD